jgi:hypothetical protein
VQNGAVEFDRPVVVAVVEGMLTVAGDYDYRGAVGQGGRRGESDQPRCARGVALDELALGVVQRHRNGRGGAADLDQQATSDVMGAERSDAAS